MRVFIHNNTTTKPMRRKPTDKNHVKYRMRRRIKTDWCRYLLQADAFERLNPEE